MQDMLVLSLLAVLRVGIPVAAILGVSYLLLRYSKAQMLSDIQAPPEAASLAPADWARAVTVPPRLALPANLKAAAAGELYETTKMIRT